MSILNERTHNATSVLRYFMRLLVGLWCLGVVHAAPQSTVILTEQHDKLSLNSHLDILEDPQRELDIQQVISDSYATQFYPNKQKIPNFGRTDSAYWIRFALNNQSELSWYIRINAMLGHDVTLYVISDNGQVITSQIAHHLPNYGLHAWSLALPKQTPLQFYIRATNGDAIFSLPVELFAANDFVEQTRSDHNLYASIIAALLIMAIYNLLSFFVLRESSYLALAIHIVSVAAIIQITRPIYASLDFLNNTDSHFFTAPIYIAIISLLAFCRELLRTKIGVPRLDQLMCGLIFISVGLIFVTGWVPQGAFLPQLMVVLTFLLIIVVSTIRGLQGYRVARHFLLIFALVTLMVVPNVVINIFANTQWQSANFYITGIATLLFLLLLSIVQAEKVRRWREQEQRVAASKEATDSFLMTISHELRMPVQAMVSIGELMQSTPLNPVQKEYLNTQGKASRHILGLVNDMLDLGAMSKGNRNVALACRPFCLADVLNDLSKIFSVSAKQKELTFTVSELPASCPLLLGDAKHLKRVLINLLDNAIKYTQQGSVKLKVDLHKNHHLPMMTVRFEVNDTGVGIPADQMSSLFEPFSQINHPNGKRNGSGLGLALSHQWVKQMEGELKIKSKPNVGSSFFFTLNWAIHTDKEYSEITVSQKEAELAPLQGIHILLVEDDALNQIFVKKLLSLRGADVKTAHNGQEAIQQIRDYPCDLVLMDLDLPDMDGYEVTQVIRADKNIPDCPIIALTAHAMGAERESCLNAGMDDYLAKPHGIDVLVEMILQHHRPNS